MTKTLLVGLTGNFGAGKSYVLELFKKSGAITINSDELVRDLLKREDIKNEVRELLGERVMSGGELNRKAIADIVFNDPYLRLKLEDIIHPEVFRQIQRIISELEKDKGFQGAPVVVEVPVLFERGYQNRFERIITVYADENTIIRRLKAKGLSADEIRRRWDAQFPYEKKLRASDFIIDNSEGKDTESQVIHIYNQLLKELMTH